MNETPFYGFVTDAGKLTLDRQAQFKAFLQHLKGHEVELQIRKRRTKRSDKQNAYYWSTVLPPIAGFIGYTVDELHEAMKAKFLGQEDLTLGLWRIGSSAKLSTAQFAEYIDRISLWAAEKLGVIVPPAEPVREMRRA